MDVLKWIDINDLSDEQYSIFVEQHRQRIEAMTMLLQSR